MEAPVRTAPAHRFVAAADGSRGLVLLAPGFFEYEWTPAGDLLFTALRATGMLSRGDLPTRPGHAGWTMATPDAQCLGEHRFDLAFAPAGSAALERPDEVMALWEDCFVPLRPLWLRMGSLDAAPPASTVELEGTGLVLSAVKPAEQGPGVVLRCCNLTGRPAAGLWRVGWDLARARRVRADEREPEEIVLAGDRRTVRFTAPPHGIVTLIVE
jgi:alpha-mannosidase